MNFDLLNMNDENQMEHVPVLLAEVVEALEPVANGRYLDGTLGLGGHSAAIMARSEARAQLCGLDRDVQALKIAGERLSVYEGQIYLFHKNYSQFEEALDELGWDSVDGALIDIGVSSMQIDLAERGFSFHSDGPLDMRMNGESTEFSARHLVNRYRFDELKKIIANFGEDPQAGRIARAIVEARDRKPIETTRQLANIVESAYPASWRAKARNHPATRTFQALRMAVNDELGELERFLDKILLRLKPGARLAIITFHSLEDRLVKHTFRRFATECICPKHLARCICGHKAEAKIITPKPIVPNEVELLRNPRSSSAKLRVVEKIGQLA